MTKWGDRPHWEMDAVYLGADAAGDWIGFPVGTVMSRPGVSITTTNEQVCLVPSSGTAVGQAWLATFHTPGGDVWTYVDMTTVPKWAGRTVRAIDLDLDIVEGLDREVYVDDQDEFDEHRVEHSYPREVVDLALATRDIVLHRGAGQVPAVRRVGHPVVRRAALSDLVSECCDSLNACASTSTPRPSRPSAWSGSSRWSIGVPATSATTPPTSSRAPRLGSLTPAGSTRSC